MIPLLWSIIGREREREREGGGGTCMWSNNHDSPSLVNNW
jgi:hypothetical protein